VVAQPEEGSKIQISSLGEYRQRASEPGKEIFLFLFLALAPACYVVGLWLQSSSKKLKHSCSDKTQ
jgi:hypothetical protein